ncbi:MAG TPA: FtsX-like permease family protein [Candidatus Limnocylindrales bacterium]|nr:FtsX-like permease family protein [Candidatus Limnocylindrales bacterium]
MGLDRLAWRTLAARPLRSLLTTLGIALGVGVLAASLAMSAGIDAAIGRTVRDVVGSADLRVSAFLERGLSDATVETIRGTTGVEVVAPTIEQRTFLAPGSPGTATGARDAVTVVGIDPVAWSRLHELELVGGARLARPDEPSALVTESLADADGYVLGSELGIQGAGGLTSLRVIGIIAGPGPVAGAAGRTVIVPLAIARSTFGLDGVTRVDIGLAEGTTPSSVTSALADRLTTEPYVVASPGDLAAGLRASTADFQATTALVAAIVLFVGSFLIVNTLSMTVGERAREVGLLRAAGATRAQVVRFVLAGALVLGIVGSALGLVVGVLLGSLMAGSVRALTGFPAEVEGLDAGSLAVAFLVGVAITLAGATEPAVRAARISPVEALRARLDLPAVRRAQLRWLAALFLAVAVIALLAWPPAAGTTGADRALAVYAVLLGATLATPFLLPPLARVLGRPVAGMLRLEERLARGSLARDRSRTALTLGSLVVGLAMIVALGWTAQAARNAATAWLADVVPGDAIVTSIRPIAADEPVDVRATLGAVDGVATVTPIATFDLAIRGVRFDAAAIVGADFLEDGRLTFVSGERTPALRAIDAGGSAILPRIAADRLGLGAGDTISLALGPGRTLDLEVAGVVSRSLPGGGGEAILVGWGDASTAIGITGADVFAVRFEDDAGAGAFDALAAASRGLALEANPLERVQGAVTDALGRVFGLFDALALVAVLVAGLGIVNTLAMGVVERVREIGVLRAIGMTRRQASRMVVVEAAILGLVGAVLGAVVGLAVGLVLLVLSGGFAASAGIPWGSIAVAAILGLAGPAIAAWYPSRLASGVSIVRALKFE